MHQYCEYYCNVIMILVILVSFIFQTYADYECQNLIIYI
ncbi:hypothetical protein SLEP1_g3374 [Rubroshorea leprosula]|uniref:Uncharacterized protein n=1 Tax=Rubroshorea leprosula TaxID=152421 RepID=A0AAV5HKN7_9ROSI|nr:hypothetical protein SLEP1_g3374 [Rubroshorea leprosula]